ncbi:MAG: MFS transporter [Thermomicrobiales bacterium]|nr:MFS transporter [Thermomicrobiales bacterium]
MTPHVSIWDRANLPLTIGSIMAVTVAAFQGLAVATITPVVTSDLGGESLYGWVFNAFLIPQIVGTVLGGREVDRRPPWMVFYPALALFAIGLIVCSVADSMGILLVGRMLVGFGCGALFSTVYAIIGASYDDSLRPAMLAAISTAWVVPSLVGPFIAGSIADTFHWRWVFVMLLPLVLLSGALTWRTYSTVVLPRDPANEALSRTRLPLAIILAIGTTLFLAGPDLTELARLVGASVNNVPVLVSGAFVVAGLVLIAPTLQRLMPAGTFTLRPMLPAAIAVRSLAFGGFTITETYVVYALKTFGELTSSQAGMILTIGSLTWTLGSVLQARWDRQDGADGRPQRLLLGVLFMIAGCGAIVADVLVTQDIFWPLAMVAWALTGLGIGICFTTATAMAFQYAPTGQDGLVSSSFLLLDLFANAIGVGIGGFILTGMIDNGRGQPAAAGTSMSLSLIFIALALLAVMRLRRSSYSATATKPSPGT